MKATRFKVGVPKCYFPKSQWPADKFAGHVEVYGVVAANRTTAAALVWQQHGEELRQRMLPTVRRVSLDVNDPVAGVGGLLGRLVPVTVV